MTIKDVYDMIEDAKKQIDELDYMIRGMDPCPERSMLTAASSEITKLITFIEGVTVQ